MRFEIHLPEFFDILDTDDIDSFLMLFALEHTLEKSVIKNGDETEYYKFLEDTRRAMLFDDLEIQDPVNTKVSVFPTSLSTLLTESSHTSLLALPPVPSEICSICKCFNDQSTSSLLSKSSGFSLAHRNHVSLKSVNSTISLSLNIEVPSETWSYSSSIAIPKSKETKALIYHTILRTVLPNTLSYDQLQEAMTMMIKHNIKAGDFVVKSGMINDKLYVVETGTYQEFISGESSEDVKLLVNSYKDEDYFGENGLGDELISRVNIQAVTDGTLWSLDRYNYRLILDSDNTKDDLNRRLLNKVTKMSKLKAPERKRALECLESRMFPRFSCIYHQGDPAEGVYIIESGTVALSLAAVSGSSNTQLEISKVGPTGIFGETCLISPDPRPLSAFALHDLKVQFLSLTKLRNIIAHYQ